MLTRHVSNINDERTVRLCKASKTKDADETTRTIRVATILSQLYCSYFSVLQTWSMLPLELVMYLIQNAVIAEVKNYSYGRWNMFGLPIGWQIITQWGLPICQLVSRWQESALMNPDSNDQNISSIIFTHCKEYISRIVIWNCNNVRLTMEIQTHESLGDFVEIRYNGLFDGSYQLCKIGIRFTNDRYSKLYFKKSIFYNKFPPLEKGFIFNLNFSPEECEKHIIEFRKYFELFQQLLASE